MTPNAADPETRQVEQAVALLLGHSRRQVEAGLRGRDLGPVIAGYRAMELLCQLVGYQVAADAFRQGARAKPAPEDTGT
jgi:hypothetical protein